MTDPLANDRLLYEIALQGAAEFPDKNASWGNHTDLAKIKRAVLQAISEYQIKEYMQANKRERDMLVSFLVQEASLQATNKGRSFEAFREELFRVIGDEGVDRLDKGANAPALAAEEQAKQEADFYKIAEQFVQAGVEHFAARAEELGIPKERTDAMAIKSWLTNKTLETGVFTGVPLEQREEWISAFNTAISSQLMGERHFFTDASERPDLVSQTLNRLTESLPVNANVAMRKEREEAAAAEEAENEPTPVDGSTLLSGSNE